MFLLSIRYKCYYCQFDTSNHQAIVDHCCQNYRDETLKFRSLNMRPFPYIFVMFLSWPFRDINKIFIDVLRWIQGLSKAEMTFAGQLTCFRLVTFYINMLMPKLFKHVNCPANVISAFDKPCIHLKTSMKILFMSRNGHDKNMTKCMRMVSCFGCRNGLSRI
jgi:hypothetical protein